MNPLPATKAQELMDVLQRLAVDRHPSEFELARVEREAQTLVRPGGDPANGHMLLGIACAFRGDWQDYAQHFRIASDLSPQRYIRRNNIYAGMRLAYTGHPLALARELIQAYPDDLAGLKVVLDVAVRALDFDLMAEAQGARTKLGAEDAHHFETQFKKLQRVHERALQLKVTSSDIVARLDAAGEVLREAREPVFRTMFDFALQGRLGYSLAIKADIDALCDLNFRIVDRLIERFDDSLADLFTIGCLADRSDLHTAGLSHPGEEAQQ